MPTKLEVTSQPRTDGERFLNDFGDQMVEVNMGKSTLFYTVFSIFLIVDIFFLTNKFRSPD